MAEVGGPVLAALGAVVQDHGWLVLRHPERLRAALNDQLGVHADEHRGVVDALVVSVEEGVPAQLREAHRDVVEDVAADMTALLQEWGLTRARAEWVVRAWRDALPEPTVLPEQAAPRDAGTHPGPGTLPERPLHLEEERQEGGRSPDAAPPPPPTELPHAAGSPSAETVLPVPATGARATELPPGARTDGPRPGPSPARGRGRRLALVSAGVVSALVLGGVTAGVVLAGDGDRGDGPDTASKDSARSGADAPTLPPATGEELRSAPGVDVPAAPGRFVMAARSGGVRLAGLGEVARIGDGDEARSAPEGGRLIGFRLADAPCEVEPCRAWKQLRLSVAVGPDVRRLPPPDGTGAAGYVVAVPAGVPDVDLVLRADGHRQALSLLTGEAARGNVEVLARRDRVTRLGRRFTVLESLSRALQFGSVTTDAVRRRVRVVSAELVYFAYGRRPSSPGRAFLKVRADYTLDVQGGGPYAFDLREIAFVDDAGVRHQAIDVDGGPGVNAVFEVPADLRRGTFRIGGSYQATAGDGTPYRVSVQRRDVPIRFG